ncbi:MAG: glycine cleavage system protein GcvH [SAR202 cluster bacterium]|nr:glycine cleavage system protein GcvH [SAR202 cluster bacterium]|tara:strand:+ start:14285 stop:14677 length:393 start_codon:yes stop_codon:yes gene_type:complete
MSKTQEMYYSDEHEWVLMETDNIALIGITKFASDNLGDIVFVELPDSGTTVNQFEQFGEIESVKAVSELYSPISGTIKEINDSVVQNPEILSESPFEKGWLLKVELKDTSELDNLMNLEAYESFLESGKN